METNRAILQRQDKSYLLSFGKKKCFKCDTVKDVDSFYKNAKWCKECQRDYMAINKDRLNEQSNKRNRAKAKIKKERDRLYYEANKEEIENAKTLKKSLARDKMLEQNKQWHRDNPIKSKHSKKKWLDNNKEHAKQVAEVWRANNKDKTKEWRANNREKINQAKNKRRKHKRINDPLWAFKDRVSKYIYNRLRKKGLIKSNTSIKYLGCDWQTAYDHIEAQFTKGMNWGNRNEWHIDHIMPLASANTEDELIKLFHYTNLQPLWAFDNMSKGATIPCCVVI